MKLLTLILGLIAIFSAIAIFFKVIGNPAKSAYDERMDLLKGQISKLKKTEVNYHRLNNAFQDIKNTFPKQCKGDYKALWLHFIFVYREYAEADEMKKDFYK
jgi:uncharacterized protein YpmB